MPHKKKTLLLASLLVFRVGLGDTLDAQTNLETNAGIQFNFTPPGAANLALGGAFVGLADDTTAAFTNPAGLILLATPQVTAELRHQTYRHTFTDHGRIEGRAPSNFGLDTLAGLQEAEAEDAVLGASFLAYAHRFPVSTLVFYRHELVNFEANFSTQGAFLERTITRSPTGIPGGPDGRLASLKNTMNLEITGYGLATAYEPVRRFSIGAALTYYDFSLDSLAERFVPPLFEPPDFRPENVVNFQTQNGTDDAWGATLGLLWRNSPETLQLGLVVRSGPTFSFQARSLRGPSTRLGFTEADQRANFHVPHQIGLGIGYLPRDAWRFALDLTYIQYSRLTDGLVDIFDLATLFPGAAPKLDQFRVEDALEVHLGVEYKLPIQKTVLLRAGLWLDPDHTLYFQGTNEAFRAIFRQQSDEVHYTFGAGFMGARYQFDIGTDLSRRIKTLAATATLRLK